LSAHQSDAYSLHRAIKYRPDIDGLRAIAVTSVVAYHAGFSWIKGGFVGVDIFFVISGYLIGSLVYKEIRGRSFRIAKFYERRAKRILPALSGVLVFSYIAAFLLLSPLEMRRFSETALATITSSSNIYFWLHTGGYFSPDTALSPLLMTWSLGVEEQFYILFPILMLILCKAPRRLQFLAIGFLATLSLAACIWGTLHSNPGVAFYMLHTRAWELAAGVLLAMFEANRPHAASSLPPFAAHALSVLGLALMSLAIFALDDKIPFPGYAALLPVSGAVLIIAAQKGAVNRLLSWRPVVFVGLVSYSWYLWHWPMLSFARITSVAGISVRVGALIGLLSFGCAVISYKFVEQPFRKSKTATPRLLLRYGALILALMLPATIFRLTNGLPQRNRAAQRLDIASQSLNLDNCMVGGPTIPPQKAPCNPGGQGRAVALIGDSHADMLAPALRTITQRSGYRLLELTKSNCPPLDGVAPLRSNDRALENVCLQFNHEVLNYINGDPNIEVVVLAWSWYHGNFHEANDQSSLTAARDSRSDSIARINELYERGLEGELGQLEQAGKSIYLVQDIPRFLFDPPRLMLAEVIRPRYALAGILTRHPMRYPAGVAPSATAPEFQEAGALVSRIAAAHPKVHLVDLPGALCSVDGCRFSEGDEMLFMDSNHLTPFGAQIALAGLHLP